MSAVVCIVVAWTGSFAVLARAGEVTCCSYVVYETEAEGPVTAPLVTFRSLGQAADATARISSDAVRLRDGNAPLRAPSQSCGRVSSNEVVCADTAESDPSGSGRWVRLVGSGGRDRLVVEPFRDAGDVVVDLHGHGSADTLIGGLGVGRKGLVSMSPRAGRDRLQLSRTGPRFEDRLVLDSGALTLRLWGTAQAAGLGLRFVLEGVGDAPTKALARGRTTVARRGEQRVLLKLTPDGAAYVGASAAGRSAPWSDMRVRVAGRDVSAQFWLWPKENAWMLDPRRGATVLQSPAPEVEAVALAADGTIAATVGCCGSEVSVLVRRPGRRWQRTPMGGELNDPVLMADGRGRLLVVGWRERGGLPALVRRERSVEGRWSPTTVIASARGLHDENPGKAAVAVDTAGRAIVSWRVHDRQYAAVRDSAGRWQRPARLGRASPSPAYREHDGDPAAVALGADGTGWVAWEDRRGRLSVAAFARGRFDRARSIGARGAHRPVIAARGDGAAVVAWVDAPPTKPSTTKRLQSTRGSSRAQAVRAIRRGFPTDAPARLKRSLRRHRQTRRSSCGNPRPAATLTTPPSARTALSRRPGHSRAASSIRASSACVRWSRVTTGQPCCSRTAPAARRSMRGVRARAFVPRSWLPLAKTSTPRTPVLGSLSTGGDPRRLAAAGVPGRVRLPRSRPRGRSRTRVAPPPHTLSALSRARALEDSDTGTSRPALPNPCGGMFP